MFAASSDYPPPSSPASSDHPPPSDPTSSIIFAVSGQRGTQSCQTEARGSPRVSHENCLCTTLVREMGFSSRVLSAAMEVVAVTAKVVEARAEENPAAEVVAASIPRRRRNYHHRSPYHSPFGDGRPISNADIIDNEDLKGLSFTDYRVSKSKKLRSPSPRSGGGGGSSRAASLQVIEAASS